MVINIFNKTFRINNKRYEKQTNGMFLLTNGKFLSFLFVS